MNPLFLIDFYKVGHVWQYPKGTRAIWSNWTPRYTSRASNEVVHFGLQYFIKKYLVEDFQTEFFDEPVDSICGEYASLVESTLGIRPDTSHIAALHRLGRLPLDIYSLPEGSVVPVGVPTLLLHNTHPDAFWLPNYLETVLSNAIWKASTSASTARIFRKIFTKWARAFGHTDLSFIDWQGHDFSFRGMSGVEDAELSGMGHLTSFCGTDTVPAILCAMKYYGALPNCGGSVPATEHSVMCAGGFDTELQTFRRLITEVYPKGVVSIVSDTWDLWKVLTEYVPALKKEILARDGKVVIRPDSGDPVKIMIGNTDSNYGPERAGVLRLLADAMGVDRDGAINKMGAIYGDGISPQRADAILDGCVRKHNLSPFNCVFGIGSYTYTYVTRDTYGFAMKATAIENENGVVPIFKDPVTDDGGKKSLCGIPTVIQLDGRFAVVDGCDPKDVDHCELNKVFSDGRLVETTTLRDVRARLHRSDNAD